MLTETIDEKDRLENIVRRLRELIHDMNNAATVTSNSLTLAQRAYKNGSADIELVKKYIDMAAASFEHQCWIQGYATDVVQNRDLIYTPKPTNLVEIVECSSHMCEGMLINQNIYANAENRESKLYFMGCRHRMTQIMINIISNMKRALKKTDDARIDINMEPIKVEDVEYVRLTIKNNGPPMPFDNTEDAFKLHNSGCNSSGLGLPICRNIIENKFDGTIDAENLEKGGVAFYITLPLCTNEQMLALGEPNKSSYPPFLQES